MKLQGEVIKAFNDSRNGGKQYTPKDDYKDADIFIAEKDRYEYLYEKGYVTKGKKITESKNKE